MIQAAWGKPESQVTFNFHILTLPDAVCKPRPAAADAMVASVNSGVGTMSKRHLATCDAGACVLPTKKPPKRRPDPRRTIGSAAKAGSRGDAAGCRIYIVRPFGAVLHRAKLRTKLRAASMLTSRQNNNDHKKICR